MGGNAFARSGANGEPPLYTPRIPPLIHAYLKDQCAKVIASHYHVYAALRDAPEKRDHGDIDFFVQCQLSSDSMEKIATELKAERIIKEGDHASIAVPWPSEAELHSAAVRSDSLADYESLKLVDYLSDLEVSQPYAQLDLRQLPSTSSLTWLSYLHSYGDLGQILGYLAYDFGLTSNDKGLHVRIEEQESSNWYGSMIFLSSDPIRVMDFLGLDPQSYENGFETVNDMFAWVSKSRTAVRYEAASRGTDATASDKANPDNETVSTPGPSTMKNDADHNRRMATRPIFARFIETVIPTLPRLTVSVSTARKQLLDDALTFFDKRSEYETRHAAVLNANLDEKARGLLVTALVNSSTPTMKQAKANEICRAVRRCLIIVSDAQHGSPVLEFRNHELDSVSDGEDAKEIGLRELLTADGEALDEGLVEWILGHKVELKDRERARAKRERERVKEEVKQPRGPGSCASVGCTDTNCAGGGGGGGDIETSR